jgi:hypothetical protein
MSAYSDDGEEDYAYDSDAALDLDEDADALLDDEVSDRVRLCLTYDLCRGQDEAPLPDKGKQPAGEVKYESLSPEKMQQRIDQDIERVVALIGCEVLQCPCPLFILSK